MIYLLTAGKKALIDGGITEKVMRELNKKKCGVLIGSAFGGVSVKSLKQFYVTFGQNCILFP